MLRSRLGLLLLLATACSGGRRDPGPREAIVAPKAAATAGTEPAPPVPVVPPAVRPDVVRIIGRCDDAQKARGKARFTLAR